MNTRDYMAMMIREFRKAKGYSTEELGMLVGRSKSAIESWEVGRSQPDADKLLELCDVLGVDIPDFFGPSMSNTQKVLEADEAELVALFRTMDLQSRSAFMVVARSMAYSSQGARTEH